MDYEGTTVAEGRLDEDGRARLGKLPVGYYEVFCGPGSRLQSRDGGGARAVASADAPHFPHRH